MATFDTDTVTPTDPIVFNYPVHNIRNYYSPTTGIYTVPVDGIYEFNIQLYDNNDEDYGVNFVVDGEDVSIMNNIVE